MEKKTEIAIAKKRRAKLLKEFNRLDCTKSKFALKHNMSSARMCKLLNMAINEQLAKE
jgi:hypothetical protein